MNIHLKRGLLVLALFVAQFQTIHAQFIVENSLTNPCEGQEVRIYLPTGFEDSYFTFCEDDDPPSGWTGDRRYRYSITYSGGNFWMSEGNNVSTSNQEVRVKLYPNSFTSPGTCTVTVKGYRVDAGTGQETECFGTVQTFTLYPRKNFSVSGPSVINAPGNQTYTATSVPGATYNWTVPSGWSIVSGGTTNTVVVSPGANDGNVGVTVSPSITACGYPGSKAVEVTDCFTHGETNYTFCSASNWSTAFATSAYGDPNKWPRMIGDFNGDDKSDVIGFGNDNVFVGLSSGSYLTTTAWSSGFTYGGSGSTQMSYPRMLGDFNGDGKTDIIGFGYDLTYVGISTGSSFNTGLFSTTAAFTYQQGFNNNNVIQRMIGDMNGDGKDDVVAFGHQQTAVGISNGSSFSTTNWSGGATFSAQTGGMSDMNKWPKMIGDFNGDGKDDVVGFGNTQVVVGLSTGSSFNTSAWTTAFTYGTDGFLQSQLPRYVGDFNGDGKDDIIGFGHTGIAVGISTGSSFNVTTWLDGEEYTYDAGWRVDAREIGVVSVANYAGNDVIRIADMNGDGKDDIIGFNGDGVFISYSTGSYFQCPAHSTGYATVGNAVQPQYLLDVANFDSTDDELEIIGLGYSDASVMNCNNCPTPYAGATPMDYSHIAQETGYAGWTVDVYNYCANNVKLDLTTTSCEDYYYITVDEFDLNNWSVIATPCNQQWVLSKAPDMLNLSSLMTFTSGKVYKINYAVGPVWSSKTIFVRIAAGPVATLTANTNTPRMHYSSGNGQTNPVYPVCSNVVSFGVSGAPSTCYSQYRYELIEVSPTTLSPIGSPLIQIPSGGGWSNGPITSASTINASSIVLGKIYRLTLYVKNSAGTTATAVRYYERTSCVVGPPKSIEAEQTVSELVSVVYPNPTQGNEVFIDVSDFGDAGASLILMDMDGKVIQSMEVRSNLTERIDVTNLATGAYLLRITGNERLENIRFIRN